mmetsp:Transcript_31106/g.52246  ORF Transcript_31106/g.52246 Transcript_31106/m.52246 type:complete len:421 (+) Transcript_31106:328-1590(+)
MKDPFAGIDLHAWQRGMLGGDISSRNRALHQSLAPLVAIAEANLRTNAASASGNMPKKETRKRDRAQAVDGYVKPSRNVATKQSGDDDIHLAENEFTVQDVQENYAFQDQHVNIELSNFVARIVSETDIDVRESVAKTVKAWAKRGAYSQANWSSLRPALAAMRVAVEAPPPPSRKCDDCGESECILRCKSCVHVGDGHKLLCGKCDQALHLRAHFHQREVWPLGFYESIPAQVQFEEDGKAAYVGKHFGVLPHKCDKCKMTGTFIDQPVAESPLLYIKHGCHHFVKASYQCQDKECGYIQEQGLAEFMRLGAWPATPVQLDCVIDISVLDRWHRHKYHGAPVSQEAFEKELHEEGITYGAEGIVNSHAFRRAYSEWRFCVNEQRHTYSLLEDLACPACGPTCKGVHLDGKAVGSAYYTK